MRLLAISNHLQIYDVKDGDEIMIQNLASDSLTKRVIISRKEARNLRKLLFVLDDDEETGDGNAADNFEEMREIFKHLLKQEMKKGVHLFIAVSIALNFTFDSFDLTEEEKKEFSKKIKAEFQNGNPKKCVA